MGGASSEKGWRAAFKQARLPWIKSLEQFDFSFQPSIDRKVIRELAGLGFVERAENVILLGPRGVGIDPLGYRTLQSRRRKRVTGSCSRHWRTLMTKLKRAQQESRLERQLQQLVYPNGVDY